MLSGHSTRLDAEGLNVEIVCDTLYLTDSPDTHHLPLKHDGQLAQIVKRAKEVWPPPSKSIPSGWSCAWESWPHLLTFYWFSPYFLMLPQIEMVVNITYKIPGETRPILFSTSDHEREVFIFTLVNDPAQFFLYDCGTQELSKILGVSTEDALIEKLGEGKEGGERGMGSLQLETLRPDAEGQSAIERILRRDDTVIPLLAEKFLDYTPEPTHPWDESLDAQNEDFTDEEELKQLGLLAEEIKDKLAAAPHVAQPSGSARP